MFSGDGRGLMERPVFIPQRFSILRALAFTFAALSLLSVSLYGAGENFKGELSLIKKLTPEERLTFFSLQYLMNQFQQKQYLSLPTTGKREEWVERFWLDLDPTPATDRNERRIEHETRVKLARRIFKKKKAPGWDKRGETLIRFGMPTMRARTSGNIGFYHQEPPGEIWYYSSLDMLVPFHDFNLRGEHIYAIEPYGRSSRDELRRLANIGKYYQYEIINNYYATEYLSPDEVKDLVDFNPDEIDYLADPDLRLFAARDLIAEWEAEKTRKSANNFYKYMKENSLIYSFEMNQELLNVYFDVTAFSGGEGLYRTEVNFEVPTEEILFVQQEGDLKANIDFRVVVRDMEMNKVTAGEDVVTAVTSERNLETMPSLLPGQVVLTLEPGYYHLGLEAIDLNSGKRGTFRTNVELPPPGKALRISDIQFASTIKETEENVKFVKGNIQVIPHPIRAYRIPYPLTVYFEIYGLATDREDLTYYSVEYAIVPMQKRKKGLVLVEVDLALSSGFETTGFGSKQVQRIEIATGNLWKGVFQLVVKVQDRRTRKVVERRATFSILD